MKSEYGLSTLGRPIVTAEIGPAPVVRDGMVAITLLLGAWVLIHVNRSVYRHVRPVVAAAAAGAAQPTGPLARAFLAVLALYNLHQVIHIAHFADNIARPVDYFEPKWLYDQYVMSTMEITFWFNVPVSIAGARLASALVREVAAAVASFSTDASELQIPKVADAEPLSAASASRLGCIRSLSKRLLLYTSSAALTVMHYRVESYRLYSVVTTFTIAGEGLAGLALALALCLLLLRTNGLEAEDEEQGKWRSVPQADGPETAPDGDGKPLQSPLAPQFAASSGSSSRSPRDADALLSPSVRRRSPVRT